MNPETAITDIPVQIEGSLTNVLNDLDNCDLDYHTIKLTDDLPTQINTTSPFRIGERTH